MSSSDERREVAARLRKYAKTETASADYLWQHLEIAVNGWQGGRFADESYVFGNDVLSRLADLIDPEEEGTCHDVRQGGGWFICSRCGAFLADGAVTNATSAIRPRFCPNCGARITNGSER